MTFPPRGSVVAGSRPSSALSLACGNRQDESRNLVRVIDLHVVACVREQEQLGGREQSVESLRHTRVQVRVGGTEDNPHRSGERLHFREPPSPRDGRAEKIGVEGEECGALGSELFVQFGDELTAVAGVGDKAADLPSEEPSIECVGVDNDPAPHIPHDGRGEEQDGLRRAQARHPSVVGVQQYKRAHPLGVVECPVDRGRAGCIVGDEHRAIKPQMHDGGIQVAGWLAAVYG